MEIFELIMWYKLDLPDNKIGSENGQILVDEEHEFGSRITLEQNGMTAPFSITCGIYGWMVHTIFFSTYEEAMDQYKLMKKALEKIILQIPSEEEFTKDNTPHNTGQIISEFIEQFP